MWYNWLIWQCDKVTLYDIYMSTINELTYTIIRNSMRKTI